MIINKKKNIHINEFNLTVALLDAIGISIDDNYTLWYEYKPLSDGKKQLAFTYEYDDLRNIPDEYTLFRPFKYEKHANIIIEVFEDICADNNENDSFDAIEGTYNNEIKEYEFYLTKNGEMVSEKFTGPTPGIAKINIVTSYFKVTDENYDKYYKKYIDFIKSRGKK